MILWFGRSGIIDVNNLYPVPQYKLSTHKILFNGIAASTRRSIAVIIPCPWSGLLTGPLPRRISSSACHRIQKISQKSTDIFSVILITRRQPVPVAIPRLSELTVIYNKIAMFVHKCLNDHAPEYLIDQCRLALWPSFRDRECWPSNDWSYQAQYVIWRPFIHCSSSTRLQQFTWLCAGLYFVWGHIC